MMRMSRLRLRPGLGRACVPLRASLVPKQVRADSRRQKSATPFEELTGSARPACSFKLKTKTAAAAATATATTATSSLGNTGATSPAYQDLQSLFIASSIPMIGFGFMDNFVMIQAGQYIDSTLGVTLGLATLTAAAAGQVVSDVSGVVFGGTLERFLTSWSLVPPVPLTSAQRQLPIARNVAMLGAVCGVVLGCAIGASVGLLTTDVAQRGREQRDLEITTILLKLLAAHSHQDWRLYLPSQGMLSWKELELGPGPGPGLAREHPQLLSDGRYGNTCQLRPLEEDQLANQCWAQSTLSTMPTTSSTSSKTEFISMPSDDGNLLYIPLGKWAVLQCRAEDQTEAMHLARHMTIVLDALLPTKS